MRNILTFTVASAIALLASSSAYASTVLFNITGLNAISFTAEQSPTPDYFTPNFFELNDLQVTINGNTSNTAIDFDNTGSIYLGDFLFVGFIPYYSGGTQTPKFLTGSYSLLGSISDSETTSTYNLKISQVAAVPEPATWAMLIFGFGAAGVAIRRTRATTLRVHYAA